MIQLLIATLLALVVSHDNYQIRIRLSTVPSGDEIVLADCEKSTVATAVTNASDGDVFRIPAGSCTWTTSGVQVPDNIGITIKGTGTPTNSASDSGADPSCDATQITVGGGVDAFITTPDYGASTMRISCMELIWSGEANSTGIHVAGTCAAGGCPNLRMDNIWFTNWSGVGTFGGGNGISAAVNAVDNVFGVMDHNTLTGTTPDGGYLHLAQEHHSAYKGVGQYGDNAWAEPEDYGTNQFIFIENNDFINSGCCENEGGPAFGGQGGGRLVVRRNNFTEMQSMQIAFAYHGTESGGRQQRSSRAFEFYQNTITCQSGVICDSPSGVRGGTGIVWGNAYNHPGAQINSLFNFTTYRTLQSIGGWGPCDGTGQWDQNEGTTYYTGVISGRSITGNQYDITVSPDPGWTTNQWVNAGLPYSVHDVDIGEGSEIFANDSDTITIFLWRPDVISGSAYAAGNDITFQRAIACLDQAAGRGEGVYLSGDPATPTGSPAQALSPAYVLMTTNNGNTPTYGTEGIALNSNRVIRNRDIYLENLNQAAQSSASSPFDGTTTIGAGHGTIALRPTSCTTGVVYWATDEGEWDSSNGATADGKMYVCVSSAWQAGYGPTAGGNTNGLPYTYPHHLVVP
jgi:hypothetical protein